MIRTALCAMTITLLVLMSASGPWSDFAYAGASSNQPLTLKADGIHSCEAIDTGRIKRQAAGADIRAQFMLSKLFERGMCVERNPDLAMKWLREAAKNGHLEAAFQLAIDLMESTAESEEALHHLKAAAEGGHTIAQHMLGLHLLSPQASAARRHEGLYWLGSAVTSGSGFSAIALGMLHERGLRGVPQNVCLAMDWYEAGQLIGYNDARYHFKRLATKVAGTC